MLRYFKNKKLTSAPESLLCIKSKYPLVYSAYKHYFEKNNPNKTDLFLSLMTRDTYCVNYFGCFSTFFIMHNIVIVNDFDIILESFKLLNERLSALKN